MSRHSRQAAAEAVAKQPKVVARFVRETWTGETLTNNPEATSGASNETSLVQLMEYDGHRRSSAV
jgi:hypothetical protein